MVTWGYSKEKIQQVTLYHNSEKELSLYMKAWVQKKKKSDRLQVDMASSISVTSKHWASNFGGLQYLNFTLYGRTIIRELGRS